MAIEHINDIENGGNKGLEDLEQPFIKCTKVVKPEDEEASGSIGVALLSTFVSVCGSFEFGSCVGFSAPTQSAIREDLDLSLAQYSMFGSLVTIGAMIGALTSGKIADLIGRKGAMRMSAAFCIAGWLAVYLSMGALTLDTGRLFTGYGIGIFSYVVPVYIAEIAPTNLRGGLTTLNQLMIVTGSSLAFVMGTVITWRYLAITGLVPCIVLLVGLFFIPESPRWLVKVGLEEEFEVSLRSLRGKDADISVEAGIIQANVQSLKKLPKARIIDLFEAKYIRSVIIAVGLMVFQQLGGINGVSFYVSETVVAAGLRGDIGTLSYAVIQVPITMVGAVLMDKTGRRPLLLVSATGTCVGCFVAGTAFLLEGQNLLLRWVPTLAVSGVLIYIASFSIGMGAVPWVIMSEIFPIHIKSLAGSLVVLINWLGAWAVSYTFNFLMSWSCSGTFFVFSGFCALTVVFVAKVVPETKGKTLEEIQASINS